MKSPKTIRYTPEQRAAVLKEIQAGASIHSVSEKTGVSVPTLYLWKRQTEEAPARAEVAVPEEEKTTIKQQWDTGGLAQRVRLLEAELARKNEVIAELSVLVLQNQGLIRK